MTLANLPPLGLKAEKPAKDRAHMARVAALPCCICEAYGLQQLTPTQVHHAIHGRFSRTRASDRETLPLCYDHHFGGNGRLGIHQSKAAWERLYGPDYGYLPTISEQLAKLEKDTI
jgi:hypothetical protein